MRFAWGTEMAAHHYLAENHTLQQHEYSNPSLVSKSQLLHCLRLSTWPQYCSFDATVSVCVCTAQAPGPTRERQAVYPTTLTNSRKANERYVQTQMLICHRKNIYFKGPSKDAASLSSRTHRTAFVLIKPQHLQQAPTQLHTRSLLPSIHSLRYSAYQTTSLLQSL